MRQQNQKLEIECEYLAQLVRSSTPGVLAVMTPDAKQNFARRVDQPSSCGAP
jgi:hypothetical protein